ncbi:hypothetical protein BJ912DRAFT_977476 [Pholiota molesta]|nr:hypothetical protein BJ912DRAFT_977476 [Pholiota molesta]
MWASAKVFDDDDVGRRRGCPRFIQGALSHFLSFTGACFTSCFPCATGPDCSRLSLAAMQNLPSTRARLRILVLNDVGVGVGNIKILPATPSRERKSALLISLRTSHLLGLVSHSWDLLDMDYREGVLALLDHIYQRCPGDRFESRRRRYWSGPESRFSGVAIPCFRGGQRHCCGKVHLPTHKVF